MAALRVFVGVLALFCAVSYAAEPALRFTVTEDGLNAATEALLPIINGALNGTVTIPEVSVDEDVPVVGHVTVTLTDITVSNVRIPGLDLKTASPDSLSGAVSGINVDVNMNFKYRKDHWPHVSDHGTVSVEASGGDIGLAFSVTAGDKKEPHLTTLSSSCSFSKFDIKFHGGASWLYNIFVDLFKGTLKDSVESAVKKAVSDAINDSANKALAKLTMSTTIGGGKSKVNLDYSLAAVNATTEYISLADELGISDNMTGVACPFQATPLPNTSPNDPQNYLHFILADSFVSCLAWVSYSNDALHVAVTHDELPGVLNTSAWSGIIPGLAKALPNAEMGMTLDLLDSPMITTTQADGTAGKADVSMNFTVLADGVARHSHALGLGLDFGMKVTLADVNMTDTMFFNVTELSVNTTALDSNFGPVNVDGLNGIFKTVLPLLKDILQSLIGKGIPIPGSPTGGGVINPNVDMGDGFIALSFDFNVTAANPAPLELPSPSVSLRGSAVAQ